MSTTQETQQTPSIGERAENKTLQEYADLYCGGDRLRAIYELMFLPDVPAGYFDRYVDELSSIEATFVVCILEVIAIKGYGGEKEFRDSVKAEQLAAQLGVETEDVRKSNENPYFKKWLWSLLFLVLAIGVSVAAAIWWHISFIGEVSIGLAATYMASVILPSIRFQRLKRLLARVPSQEEMVNVEGYVPDFETVINRFYASGFTYPEAGYMGNQNYPNNRPVLTEEEGKAQLLLAKKRLIRGLWMLPVCLITLFVLLMLSTIHSIVAIVAAVAFFALVAWVVVSMFRAVLRARDGYLYIKDEEECQRYKTKQSGYVAWVVLLSCVYFLLTFIGCGLCINFAVLGL